MRRLFRGARFVGPLFLAGLMLAVTTAAPTDTANAAAFARLFGVLRYFYPSDAAASLDWNQFAVDGVKKILGVPDAAALQTILQQLTASLGPGIAIGTALRPSRALASSPEPLVAWRYLGPGFSDLATSPYQAKRTNRALIRQTNADGVFFTLLQSVPAESLRGRAIRLRGQVRATPTGAGGGAALWLRVDRPAGQRGFFDNMSDRPVRSPEWRDYSIEGTVAADATDVYFGVMAPGSVTADFDQIELAVRDGAGNWTVVPIKDPGFEDATPAGWTRGGTTPNVVVSQPTPAPEGRQYARFTPAGLASVTAELFEEAPPQAGDHVDFDLGLGLRARVPLALTDAEARATSTPSPRGEPRAIGSGSADQPELATRLADVIVAWNVYRHFYPYWSRVDVDWDGRLQSYLNAASIAATRAEELDTLRQLVADVRDGHGRVQDPIRRDPQAWAPIQLALVEDRVVVAASRSADAPVGAVVTTIDGVPATQRIAHDMLLWSGTPQWRTFQALQNVVAGANGSSLALGLDSGNGPRQLTLRRESAQMVPEARPSAVAQLSADFWYVDLTRVPWAQLQPRLEELRTATGLVFDVRGYPTDAGSRILPYLLDAPEADRWMHVPKIVGPFGADAGSLSVGWNVKPANPHLAANVAFLTDGRAISYAESVMGYVSSHHLGTIVGGTTAGTNGDIATFTVPGGFRVTFTGMRVTQHDGRPHHLVGVQPDIPALPTLEGLRAGRDDVLERALALIRTPR